MNKKAQIVPVAAAAGGGLGFVAILAIALGIPILIFGLGSVFMFFKAVWSPVTSGSIPIWVIVVLIILFVLIMRKFRR